MLSIDGYGGYTRTPCDINIGKYPGYCIYTRPRQREDGMKYDIHHPWVSFASHRIDDNQCLIELSSAVGWMSKSPGLGEC